MRVKLEEIGGAERHTYVGVFERFGTKRGYKGIEKTVLLKDIVDEEGNYVTDHLWFNYTKGFQKLDLKSGVKVQFCARVAQYEKGYFGYREDVYVPPSEDFKLSFPTKIRLVND